MLVWNLGIGSEKVHEFDQRQLVATLVNIEDYTQNLNFKIMK